MPPELGRAPRIPQEGPGWAPGPARNQGKQTRREIRRVASQQFIGSLTIQHHLDPMLMCQAEDTILGVNAGTAEWLIQGVDEGFNVLHQVIG